MDINNQNNNDKENDEKHVNDIKNIKPNFNEELKNILLIKNNSEYKLNLFSLITKVSSSKDISHQRIENEYILNLLLTSSKLNKPNKLLCLLLLFYLNQDDKNKDNLLNYLFSKITKLSSKQESNIDFENYIHLNETSFLLNQNNLFYSKKNIFLIKKMVVKKNCDLKLLTTIENLSKDISKNIKLYLDSKREEFLNKTAMDDNKLNKLKNIIYQLCDGKNEIPENCVIYLISKSWAFRAKLFIQPYFEARKENIENLLLEHSFLLDKVYESFMGKEENNSLKNYYGIIFPGPINNYEMIDLKDNWVDPINEEENIFLKDSLKLNEDYFIIGENDWNFLKEIFGATNDIKKTKKNTNFYKNKILIIEPRLRSDENKNLLKNKIFQINLDSTIKDFKKKIIRCINYEMSKENYIHDEKIYEENDVKLFYTNKLNKDILIEICVSFAHNNKFYESLYIQEIKYNNDEDSIKDIFNYYDNNNYFFIAEIIPKNSTKSFIHPITYELNNNSNIYNCSICGEQLNLIEKYNCDLCNLSLFCSYECGNISGEHKILHEFLNKIYIKKFDLKLFINEKFKTKKDATSGIVSLEKDKNSTCINSIIHCFSNNIDLTKYFLNKIYTNDINITDFLTIKDTLVNKYYNLIEEMWLGNKYNKKIKECHKDFIQLIIKKLKVDNNSNSIMNNTHEILIFLLGEFHKELNRYTNTEKIIEKVEENEEDNGLDAFAKKDNSIINDLFQGIYQSSLSCSNCGNVSMIYDFFTYILLPIPKKNNNLFIKCFNEFECKNIRYVLEDSSTIRHLKDKAVKNISDKINHLISIMSLTELIDVTAFDMDDEKILTYTAMYNSIELVQFDKNKVLNKVYMTDIKSVTPDEDNNNSIKKNEYNDFNLQLSRIYRENDAELVFYEKSVIDKECINIYIYPFLYNEKERLNKSRDKLFNVYPIAISAKLSLILDNFNYLVNVKLRDLLLDHYKEESERRQFNYIELVYPHFFCNSPFYSQANCFLCKEKKKNSLFCPLFSSIEKNKTIKDLMNLFEYPKQPIMFIAKCKYYDTKTQIYSNMNCFPSENPNKKVPENKLDIYDCFELYTKKESIVGMDWFCESCNSLQVAQKQLLIYKPPLYLIIQFDRFSARKSVNYWNNYGIDDSLIHFPINNLNIEEYVEGPEKKKAKYNLYAAIYREISPRNDSIYSVCRNNKKWIMYKDTKVLLTNAIVNKNAHFLFYRREDIKD